MFEIKITFDATPSMLAYVDKLSGAAGIVRDFNRIQEESKASAGQPITAKIEKAKAAVTEKVKKEEVTAPVPAEEVTAAEPSSIKEEKPEAAETAETKKEAPTIEDIRILAASKAKAGKRDAIKAKLIELGAQNITTLSKDKYGVFAIYLKTL